MATHIPKHQGGTYTMKRWKQGDLRITRRGVAEFKPAYYTGTPARWWWCVEQYRGGGRWVTRSILGTRADARAAVKRDLAYRAEIEMAAS